MPRLPHHTFPLAGLSEVGYWASWFLTHWPTLMLSGVACALIGTYPFAHTDLRCVRMCVCVCVMCVCVCERERGGRENNCVHECMDIFKCVLVALIGTRMCTAQSPRFFQTSVLEVAHSTPVQCDVGILLTLHYSSLGHVADVSSIFVCKSATPEHATPPPSCAV